MGENYKVASRILGPRNYATVWIYRIFIRSVRWTEIIMYS